MAKYDVTIQYTIPVEADNEDQAVAEALELVDEVQVDEGNVIDVTRWGPRGRV